MQTPRWGFLSTSWFGLVAATDCFGWQVYEGVIFYNLEMEKLVEKVCVVNQFG